MTKKIIINIKSLTINVGAEGKASGIQGFALPSGLIQALMAGIMAGDMGTNPTSDAPAAAETAAPEAQAETSTQAEAAPAAVSVPLTQDNILAFLNSDARYTLRTSRAVVKAFSDADESAVISMLMDMAHAGKVAFKHRRRDGQKLVKALVAAQVQPVEEAAPATTEAVQVETFAADEAGSITTATTYPELTETNIRSFIASDARYTQRTADAIAKHFGIGAANEQLQELLQDMYDTDSLSTSTRRRDGTTLYANA